MSSSLSSSRPWRRISRHMCPQLDESQGGFGWDADALVGSLVSVLSFVPLLTPSLPSSTLWVEGTLVRLFDAGVLGCMWRLFSHILRSTQSKVLSGASLSDPWSDTGIALRREAHARHLVSRGTVCSLSALLGPGQNVSCCGSRPISSCLTCCRASLEEWIFSVHLHPPCR